MSAGHPPSSDDPRPDRAVGLGLMATEPAITVAVDGASSSPLESPPPSSEGAAVGRAVLDSPDGRGDFQRATAAGGPAPSTIIGQYQLIRRLGQGGMGVVYLARDTRLGRLVAIKFVTHSRVHARRFIAEARNTARCSHENIVIVHDIAEHRGSPYMVLEYLEGRTLRQWMNVYRPFSGQRAVEIMVPVVRALVRAHGMGIIHRDLKPENIMVTDSGTVKVLDFGLAKLVGGREVAAPPAPEPASLWTTAPGTVVGTRPYMSPEQLSGEGVDHRSDIWAVGIILYELVAGRHPLEPLSRESIEAIADLEQPMPDAATAAPRAGVLASIINRCLIKRKIDRTGTAQELLAELEPLLPDREEWNPSGDENPFAGLSAFQERDAARFFGRSREIAAVLTRLRNQPLVALGAPSGAGKSSLVRAGVIPALKRAGEGWQAFIVRPGRQPLVALANLLASARSLDSSGSSSGDGSSASTSTADGPSSGEDLAARLVGEPGLFAAELRSRASRKQRRVLVFVDQFEELYTLGAPAARRAAFIACLAATADDASAPLRVVISMRSDFLDRLSEEHRFAAEVTRGLIFVPPMSRDGLREALTRPVAAADYRFESEDIVDEMLDALEHTRGAPALLQFTAAVLWENRDRERRLLTEKSYHQLGGIAGTLSRHADAVLAAMSAAERATTRTILERLVTPERTRAITEMSEIRQVIGTDADADTAVQRLAAARLVLIETGHGESTVELVHESLISGWPTLRRWLDEQDEDVAFLARLRGAAKQWEESRRSQGVLWRGEPAREARLFRDRYRGHLGAREAEYLDQVLALAERSSRIRRRAVIGGFVALAAVAAALGILAWKQSQASARAERESRRATAELIRARDATRLAVVTRLSETDPTTALALLREVDRPGETPSWTPLTLRALESRPARAVLPGPGGAVHAVAFSPAGDRVALGSAAGIVRVYRVAGTDGAAGEIMPDGFRDLAGHTDAVYSVEFSPDGSRVLTASLDGTARIHRVGGADGGEREPVVLSGHEGAIWSARFSPDGAAVLTASADGTARIWAVTGRTPPVILRGHDNGLRKAVFSDDGTRVATASYDGTARIWTLPLEREPQLCAGHGGAVIDVAFDTTGGRVVTASLDGTARVFTVQGESGASPPPPVTLSGHAGTVTGARFSRDGGRVITTSSTGEVWAWNLADSDKPRRIGAHDGYVYALAITDDGRRALTGSADGNARVWAPGDESVASGVLSGHTAEVTALAVAPGGRWALTASEDGSARIWPVAERAAPAILTAAEPIVTGRFTPDGKAVVIASADGVVELRPIAAESAPGWRLETPYRGEAVRVELSRDGERLLAYSGDPGHDDEVRVWTVGDDDGPPVVLEAGSPSGWLRRARFNPDGTLVAITAGPGSVWIHRSDGGGEPLVLGGEHSATPQLAFSLDGKLVVRQFLGEPVQVWRIADGSLVEEFAGYDFKGVSPDGPTIALERLRDSAIELRRPGQRAHRVVLSGHRARVHSLAFSRDGALVAGCLEDQSVRVWRTDGSGEPLVLRGHTGRVGGAEFSRDGRRLLTGAVDGTVRIWTLDGTAAPLVFRPESRGFTPTRAGFDPTGTRILAASSDGNAYLWPAHRVEEPSLLSTGRGGIFDAEFSSDGQRVLVRVEGQRSLRVWTVAGPPLEHLLWRATSYCIPVEERMRLLALSRNEAEESTEHCLARVREAASAP